MGEESSPKIMAVQTPKKSITTKSIKPKTIATHPKTSEMVTAAITNLKERGGSSLQAIKKYINSTYKIDSEKQASFIRKYLKSAVEQGKLIRTTGKGASGSFKLGIVAKPKVVKPKAAVKPKSLSKKSESSKKEKPNKLKKVDESNKTAVAKKSTAKKVVPKKTSEKNVVENKSIKKVATKKSPIKKTKKTPSKLKTPKPKKTTMKSTKTATKN